MASQYTDIQKAFQTKLEELSDLPIVVAENTLGEKIQTASNGALQTKYIRTELLPATTADLSIGITGFDKYQGIFQIDIFTPYENGIDETNYWVDEIINHFKQRDPLTIPGGLVRVITRSRLIGFQSTNYHQCGVSLEWESYLTK